MIRFHVSAGKQKATVSQKVFPPPHKIPLSSLLNGGCHCSPLKYCSKGPNIASHPTIHKCSGVQINLNLKLTTKTISNLHLSIYHPSCISNLHYPSIHPSNLPQKLYLKLTLSIHSYIHPSFHPSIHLTYHKNYLKPTLIHPSILFETYIIHPFIHPSDLPQKLSQTYTIHPSIHPSI